MLSYRHGFHAGNGADVLKHGVLIHCLDYLKMKEKPFLAMDTHAGAGFYSLTQGYGAQNREWERGVQRLLDKPVLPPLLTRYTSLVKDALAVAGRYPGSPAIIQHLIRPQDRAACFELHPADFAALEENLAGDRRFRVLREDGLGGLKALLPPPSRRACVFIDPSYEIKTDYTVLPERIAEAIRRFPSGMYITWYPLLRARPPASDAFFTEGGTEPGESLRDTLLGLYPGNRCAAELRVTEPGNRASCDTEPGNVESGNTQDISRLRMYGSGLVIYNPPWTLRARLEEELPVLASLLGDPGGSWELLWEPALSTLQPDP
jgi:23S rRNA (adenine2030-N6)-methyltransferase